MKLLRTLSIAGALSIATLANAADVVGTTSGKWVNPLPAGSVSTGAGTPLFTWGQGVNGSLPSSMSFTSASFSAALESPFKVGSISYFNGGVISPAATVSLALALDFAAPALGQIVSNYAFDLVNTGNTTDPDASADYVNLPSAFSTTSFLIDGITYGVKIAGFQNVVGDGFLVSNPLQFHVREQGTASADLYAVVTTQIAAVPEPTTYGLMVAGLLMVATVSLRRTRRGDASTG